MQMVAVNVIVLIALAGAVYYAWKKLKAMRRNKGDSPCSDCPLKGQCSKPMGERLSKKEDGCDCGGGGGCCH